MLPILFLHGLHGSPNGPKARLLRERYGALTPDLAGLDLDVRVARAAALLDRPHFIVGSSLGGLMAVRLAEQRPALVPGYLLLAPAVWPALVGPVSYVPPVAAVLHGRQDSVVDVAVGEAFAAQHAIPFHTVEDGHTLDDSYDTILSLCDMLLSRLDQPPR